MKVLTIEGLENLIIALEDVADKLISEDGEYFRKAIYRLGRIIEKMECIRVQEEEENAASEG